MTGIEQDQPQPAVGQARPDAAAPVPGSIVTNETREFLAGMRRIVHEAIEGAVEALVERVTKSAVENVLQQAVEGVARAQEVDSSNSPSGRRRRRAQKLKA